MMSLPSPTIDHEVMYEASRERFSDRGYKKRLADGQASILAAGVDYIHKGMSGQLFSLPEHDVVAPSILAGDMPRLYNQGLLRKNSEARKLYEKIRLSSPFRVCPFCVHRNVKTLDHYLPKQKYAAYAVLPSNLIPCCRDCNSDKDEFAAVDRSSAIIHPYFDDVDARLWLGCDFEIDAVSCTPTFFIDKSEVEEDVLPRLISHMEVLDLFDLYDIEGAREINDMSETLLDTLNASGEIGVQSLCASMARSRSKLARNYWRATLWRCASQSRDFCNLQWMP